MTPLFSVVIPLYNKADTIERTIRSVQGQSFKDYELIVVNDGSTDGSLDVVQRLAKEIQMRIIDKPNGGVSSARNAGANVAEGRFVALLDGDDVWVPGHLKRMAKLIWAHPGIRFFGGGYQRDLLKCVYFTIPWPGSHVRDVYSAFKYGQVVNSSTVVVDRKLWIEVGGFDSRYAFYEDFEFFFRLARYTKICIIGKVSAIYKQDAKFRLTKSVSECSSLRLPHIAYVERNINERTDDVLMRSYARVQANLFKSMSIIRATEFKTFAVAFPSVSKLTSVNNKLAAFCFIWWYRFRCHLSVWRRSV